MKTIVNYIKESKHSFRIFSEAKHSFRIFSEAKHSFRIKSHLKKQKKIKDPEEGTTAYNIDGVEFEIVSVFYVPDIKTENEYKDLLTDYDYYGAFNDEFAKLSDIQEYEFIVACQVDNFGHTALFVWGNDGVCYEYAE